MIKDKEVNSIDIPMGEELYNKFTELMKQEVEDRFTNATKELDTTLSAKEQYNQLADMFLNRKGKRQLFKSKKKESFSSNFYKKIQDNVKDS